MFVYSPTKQSDNPLAPARRDDLRAHNTALLLRALWADPEGASRADLARQSGLSRATVSAISAELLDAGVVIEGERRTGGGGRPARMMRFYGGHRCLLGVELGASHVSAVRTDLRGRVLATLRQECDVQRAPVRALEVLGGILDQLMADAQAPVFGVGLGVPSPIVSDRSGQLSPDLFPRWKDIDLAKWVHSHTGLPCLLDNDANLGALAEHWWGHGRGRADFAYVKVATGVGAGIIINGDIFRGAGGIAGEIGHTAIDPNGPVCRCGLAGCLEALVGTQSLLERAREQAAELAEPPEWGPEPTLLALVEAARGGDVLACNLIATTGHWLGIALANLLNLVNPSCVILGGRLTLAGDLLLRPLRAAMAARALWSSVAESQVVISTLPGEPIALGAATLVLQAALSQPGALLSGEGLAPLDPLWRLHA